MHSPSPKSSAPADKTKLPVSIYALVIAAFAIGTTEFVVMGLLPEVAGDLKISIPTAGWLVSGYALGVAIGAPIMAVLTARLPRRTALLALMGIFIVGNLLCATALSYEWLMVARVITALCHGAFFGIGAVVAANLAPPHRRAAAMAAMFSGLTLANVLGVPLGTALGQYAGWRSTFWVVSALGVITFFALLKLLPATGNADKTDLKREIRALAGPAIWTGLMMTVLFSAAAFALFTYIAPILRDVTQISSRGVTLTLLLIGLGLTLGNILGGRLADWKLMPSLIGIFAAMAVIMAVFPWASPHVIAAEIVLFVWATVSFAAASGLQVNMVTLGRDAPSLVSTLNIGAFNVGNAIGAWLGGTVIARGHGLNAVPLAGAVVAAAGLGLAIFSYFLIAGKKTAVPYSAPQVVS